MSQYGFLSFDSLKTGIFFSELLTFWMFASLRFPTPLAERSLAIPYTPKQSGLFGVIAISIIGSILSKTLITFSPGFSSSSSIMP